jgi:hypothetical protein
MFISTPINSDGKPAKFRTFFDDLCRLYGRHVHKSNTVGRIFTKDDVPALSEYINSELELAGNNTAAEENVLGARILLQDIDRFERIEVAWKE